MHVPPSAWRPCRSMPRLRSRGASKSPEHWRRRFEVPTAPAASPFRNFKSKKRHQNYKTASAPLLPKFVSRVAAMTDEIRRRGTVNWLTARPVAHRGLHDATRGVIENTPSSVAAAIAANYAIEVDLQITADGEAMVHHDDNLGRLTDGGAALKAMGANELRQVPFKATADRMISLSELCDLVAGRVTLVLELKSHFDDDRRLP